MAMMMMMMMMKERYKQKRKLYRKSSVGLYDMPGLIQSLGAIGAKEVNTGVYHNSDDIHPLRNYLSTLTNWLHNQPDTKEDLPPTTIWQTQL